MNLVNPLKNPDDTRSMDQADFGAELHRSMPEPSAMAPEIMAKGETYGAPPAGPTQPAGELPKAPVVPVVAAGDTCELFFTLAQGTMGDEWEPTLQERGMCVRALEKYYEKYGSFDLPPGWAVVAAFGCYAVPRMKTKLTGLMAGLLGGPAEGPAVPDVAEPGRPVAVGFDANPIGGGADPFFGVPVKDGK